MAKWVYRASILMLLLGFAGCAPPPPPPTEVDLTLIASKDVNPTETGEAAPVVVRIYQLASTSGFEKAEFYQLFNQDEAVLKTDLVKKDEFLLKPGETKTTTLSPTDQVKAIGVLAAYRDFQKAKWRTTVPVPPHKTTPITVTVGHDGVTATAPPPKSGS